MTILTVNHHVQPDTTVTVTDLANDDDRGVISLAIGEEHGTRTTFLGDLESIERFLDEALVQVVRLKAARRPFEHEMVAIADLAEGDAVSFDGTTWSVVTKVDPDPFDWTIELYLDGSGGNNKVRCNNGDAVRRRLATVHAVAGRVA